MIRTVRFTVDAEHIDKTVTIHHVVVTLAEDSDPRVPLWIAHEPRLNTSIAQPTPKLAVQSLFMDRRLFVRSVRPSH